MIMKRRLSILMPIGIVLITLTIVIADKCVNECTCKWKSGKRTVECINRSLTSIPDKIDGETQVLDLSNNDIKLLDNNIFIRVSLTNLQRLYLRYCRIELIENDSLTGLTNLIELDLSYNRLKNIPSMSLRKAPFLRDLSLSNNPLKFINNTVFSTTPNLVKLDLSNAKLNEIEVNGFNGLNSLESLKLNGNNLTKFYPGTFQPLNKIKSIELHENPWICNCHLRELRQWLTRNNLPLIITPVCSGPEQLQNRPFNELELDDFACRPVLVIASRYAEATIGENASIVCRVSSIPPAKVKWFWNGKLLTNQTSFSTHQKIFIYEEGQFSKRSTLILTNAQESDSSEFYCSGENRAGSVEANFTLHVSLRTAGMSTLGSGQIAGISAALVVLILFILLIILVLFVRLRRMPLKDVKSATIEVVAGEEANGFASSNNKIEEEEKPVSLGLNYVQRHDVESANISGKELFEEARPVVHGQCYSSTASLVPIDNPDLIRDTRTNIEELGDYGGDEQIGNIIIEDRLIYSSLWNTERNGSYTQPNSSGFLNKDGGVQAGIQIEQFPPGAKQLRVWQKGVPVLPPVSALKRVLGSTRSSPDEGYQEGTGTDV